MYTTLSKSLEPVDNLQFRGHDRINAAQIDVYVNETDETVYVGTADGRIMVLPPPNSLKQPPVYPGYFTVSRKSGVNNQNRDFHTHNTESRLSDITSEMLTEEQRRLAKHLADPRLRDPNPCWNTINDAIFPVNFVLADSRLSVSPKDIRESQTGVLYLEAVNITVALDYELILKNTHPFLSMRSNHLDFLADEQRYTQGFVFELIDPHMQYDTIWFLLGNEAIPVRRSRESIRQSGLYIKTKTSCNFWKEHYFSLEGLLDGPRAGIKFWATAEEAMKNTLEAIAARETEDTKLKTEQAKAIARAEAIEFDRLSAARKEASDGIKFWATLVTALVTIVSGLIAIFRR